MAKRQRDEDEEPIPKNNQSFLSTFAQTVKRYIPWFKTDDSSNNSQAPKRRRLEEATTSQVFHQNEELEERPPECFITSQREPYMFKRSTELGEVAANGDDQSDNSDGSASTSGCSSLVSSHAGPSNKTELVPPEPRQSFTFHPIKPTKKDASVATEATFSSNDMHLGRKPLWSEHKKLGFTRQTPKSSRPTFNISMLGPSNMPSTPAKSSKSVFSSPFYHGKTTYGGQSASKRFKTTPRPTIQPTTLPIHVPVTSQKENLTSATLKTFLKTLETLGGSPPADGDSLSGDKSFSTPFFKLNTSKYKPTPRSKVAAPPVNQSSLPVTSDLKSSLETSIKNKILSKQEDLRPRFKEPTNNKPTENMPPSTNIEPKGGFGGKMKSKTFSNHFSSKKQDEKVEELDLAEVPLPIKTLPVFSFPSFIKPKDNPPPKVSETKSFTFSSPLHHSTPHIAKPNKEPSATFNFSSPISNFKPKKKANLQEKVVVATPLLKQGSVLDGLKNMDNKNLGEPNGDIQIIERPKGWICGVCFINNEASTINCAACNEPKQNLQEMASSSMPTWPKGYAAKFNNGWSCNICLVTNDINAVKCTACEEPKPGTASKPEVTSVTTSWPKGFASQFSKGWSCTICLVSNSESSQTCISCTEPRPGTKSKPEIECIKAPSSAPSWPKGFAASFNKGWICDICLVNNDANAVKCTACEEPKRLPKSTSEANTVAASWPKGFASQFNKGWTCTVCLVNNKDSVQQCASCSEPRPKPKPTQELPLPTTSWPKGFASQFNKGWSCPICMVNNESSKTKCVACETPSPFVSTNWSCGSCLVSNPLSTHTCQSCSAPKNPKNSEQASQALNIGTTDIQKSNNGSFVFGSSNKSLTFGSENLSDEPKGSIKYQFGIPLQKDSSTTETSAVKKSLSYQFGTPTDKTKENILPQFGTSSNTSQDKPKVAATFQFGTPQDKTKGTVSFQFGTPQEKPKETTSFQFGTPQQKPKETVSFQMGTPQEKSKETTSFQFGTPKEAVTFQFGTPQDKSKEATSDKAKPSFQFGVSEENVKTSAGFKIGFNQEKTKAPSFQFGTPQENIKDSNVSQFSNTQEKSLETNSFQFGASKENINNSFQFGNPQEKPKDTQFTKLGDSQALSKESNGFQFTPQDKSKEASFQFGTSRDKSKDLSTFQVETSNRTSKETGGAQFFATQNKINAIPTYQFGVAQEKLKDSSKLTFGETKSNTVSQFNTSEPKKAILQDSAQKDNLFQFVANQDIIKQPLGLAETGGFQFNTPQIKNSDTSTFQFGMTQEKSNSTFKFGENTGNFSQFGTSEVKTSTFQDTTKNNNAFQFGVIPEKPKDSLGFSQTVSSPFETRSNPSFTQMSTNKDITTSQFEFGKTQANQNENTFSLINNNISNNSMSTFVPGVKTQAFAFGNRDSSSLTFKFGEQNPTETKGIDGQINITTPSSGFNFSSNAPSPFTSAPTQTTFGPSSNPTFSFGSTAAPPAINPTNLSVPSNFQFSGNTTSVPNTGLFPFSSSLAPNTTNCPPGRRIKKAARKLPKQ